MGGSVAMQTNGKTNKISLADAIKQAEEKRKKRFEVPEGKSAEEYKALAQKFSNKYKELVNATNDRLRDINVTNFKRRAEELRDIASKEGFESGEPQIGGSEYMLMKKNEQITTLVVAIIVLITAFIIVGCYMFMRGGMPLRGTNGVAVGNAYNA